MPPRSAYIHVPFCRHRCGYCNFTLIAGRDDLIESFLAGLERELAALAEPRPVETLFFGGGTPSHLPPAQLGRLMELVLRWHPLLAGGEFSIEANPLDVTDERAEVLRAHGVTRVSLGAQSFRAAKLALLERDHAADDIACAVRRCRAAGIRSVSLDLIFGTPGETRDHWDADLTQALALEPDHLSTYGLTIERGTAFYGRRERGELTPAAENDEAWMYERAIDRLAAAGFEHYEVSNFARFGHRCRHNEVYWSGGEFFAAGPGAARFVGGRREVNHRSTTTWLRRVRAGESPVAESETLPADDAARELFVFGLRRLEGVARTWFKSRAGLDLDELVGPELRTLVELELLADDGQTVRLTRRGLLVSDSLWPRLLRQ